MSDSVMCDPVAYDAAYFARRPDQMRRYRVELPGEYPDTRAFPRQVIVYRLRAETPEHRVRVLLGARRQVEAVIWDGPDDDVGRGFQRFLEEFGPYRIAQLLEMGGVMREVA